MDKTSFSVSKSNNIKYAIAIGLFLFFAAWFFYVHLFDLEKTERMRDILGHLYQVMALYGAILGIVLSRNWGGYKSMLGRAVLFLSLSLLFQNIGQTVSSYFVYLYSELPYPSLGDVGFFGSTILYIIGLYSLARASGLKFAFKSTKGKIIALIIPVIMLTVSFFFFLKGYEFDWSNKLKVFLDLGYPIGDAVYVSIAILTFTLARSFLGGIMKKPVLFLALALIFQYIADFTFLYQSSRGTWYIGGLDDFLYFLSYSLMTCSLIYIGSSVFKKIKES